MNKKLGLIVNPIAGMGGRVGLKGTDRYETLDKAIKLGAKKEAPKKAVKSLKYINDNVCDLEILTYPGDMGENECKQVGIFHKLIGKLNETRTTSKDTINAALKMLEEDVDLILFAGGDGTARDIYNVIGNKKPVIGIPAGVKIHSAVFANNPLNAGKIVESFYTKKNIELVDSEVMDIDEEKFREGKVIARLFGYMKVPYEQNLVQSLKAGGIFNNEICLEGIADYVIDNMVEDCIYVIGSGTTTRKVLDRMNLPNTLLGVDAVKNKQLIASDANENEIYNIIKDKKFKIIVSPIGGQGYIFGRGNQQISPKILSPGGKENILIISTPEKIISLKGKPLLVDTGDEIVDNMLKGYYRVIVGYDETYVYKCGY